MIRKMQTQGTICILQIPALDKKHYPTVFKAYFYSRQLARHLQYSRYAVSQ
jgi:hypothetical protein